MSTSLLRSISLRNLDSKREQATGAVAALFLRMAEASGFPRRGSMSESTEVPPAPEFYQAQPALKILLEERIRLRQLEEAHQKLVQALQPFIGACGVINHYRAKVPDELCLMEALPAGWPTVGQLRELVRAAQTLPSPLEPKATGEAPAVVQEPAEKVPEQVKPEGRKP